MTTTRIYGNNPFEVYLKPTNKIEITVSGSNFSVGDVVAYNNGTLVRANASNRATSSVLGVVTAVPSAGSITVVTQGVIGINPKGFDGSSVGDVLFLSPSNDGEVQPSPPVALGTTRIPVVQKLSGQSYLVLGIPGIVNGLSYRGYVNISAIQPVGTVSPFIGSTTSVPKNWLLCDGSYVSVDTYPELYRLIGSIYGPVLDGRFKLPDFRGRTLVGAGNGDQLTPRFIGELGGSEKHQLAVNEMPSHSHKPAVGTNSGVDFWWGSDERVGAPNFDYDGAGGTKPNDGFIAPSTKTDTVGGNSPHNNMPPYSVANWIIRAKAESEFALLDVNVESLTNVDKGATAAAGDLLRYDGATWKFVQNKIVNSVDFTAPTNISTGYLKYNGSGTNVTVESISGSNIVISDPNPALTHTNGSPRPVSKTVSLGSSFGVITGRKGIIHLHGTLEIESTTGSIDGTVNVNLVGYSGSSGLTVLDTITIPHYIKGDVRSMKIPFHATVAAEVYLSGTDPTYKFGYYLSTATGSQFKANKLTINNVKFVF